MILMEFLLAPTVPSEPRPQNLHSMVEPPAVLMCSPTSRERWVTSSTMPTVKWFFCSPAMLSYTAFIWAGVVSLELRPYRPASTLIPLRPASARAVHTSSYRGSPMAPGSLVRSRTEMVLTVSGSLERKWDTEKGRYRWTWIMPTFWPWAFR